MFGTGLWPEPTGRDSNPSAQPPLVADSHGLAGGDDLNPHPAVAGRPVAIRHGSALNGKGEQEQRPLFSSRSTGDSAARHEG